VKLHSDADLNLSFRQRVRKQPDFIVEGMKQIVRELGVPSIEGPTSTQALDQVHNWPLRVPSHYMGRLSSTRGQVGAFHRIQKTKSPVGTGLSLRYQELKVRSSYSLANCVRNAVTSWHQLAEIKKPRTRGRVGASLVPVGGTMRAGGGACPIEKA
jgi:hypothetical protein